MNSIKLARLVRLYRTGYSIRQVAAAIGVTYNTVHYHLKRQGVPFRPVGPVRKADRMPDPEASK